MAGENQAGRPALGADAGPGEAAEAVTRLVAELQAGIDHADADQYNRHFAADVMWGSPFGATVQGYEALHAIHTRLLGERRGGPSSRYEIETVRSPAPDVALAQVRRVALGPGGTPLAPSPGQSGAFSEMALYVLIRRNGIWWLAAGQNTPIQPAPPAPG